MHRIFISDLHLEDPDGQTFQRFAECLATESGRADEIYILGDLVEMWIGDDDDGPCALALANTLKQTSEHCDVFVMHGNRDFLFGDMFAKASGTKAIADPHMTSDGILLTHGDALCTDDLEYQQARALMRSEAWQNETLAKTLAERKAYGQSLREQSRQTNANKSTNIMDVNAAATAALLAEHGASRCVHGHTHRPGDHRDDDHRRVVLGAWERCGWLCRQQDDALSLECFSLARRYGT